jgi:hypothetical protein
MGLDLLNKLLPETEITGEILRPRVVISLEVMHYSYTM